MTPKFCMDCKHCIGLRSQWDTAEFWKCGAPSNIKSESDDLVTGGKVREYRWMFCASCRNDPLSCGTEGKWFEPYRQFPEHQTQGDALLEELNQGVKQ